MRTVKYKIWILSSVFILTTINIGGDYIVSENCSEKINNMSYFIFNNIFSPEFYVALTTFYPLIMTFVLLWVNFKQIEIKLLFLFLGLVGLLNTCLLWVVMHLHLDCIVHYTFVYYSILIVEFTVAFLCISLPWFAKHTKLP